MKNLILLVSLIVMTSVWSKAFAQTSDNQNKESMFFIDMRERLANINAKWDDSEDLEKFKENLNTYLKLRSETDKLQEFSRKYSLLLRKLVEDEKVLTGHNIHIMSEIIHSYYIISLKANEFSSIYAPGDEVKNSEFVLANNKLKTQKNLLWLSIQMNLFDNYLDIHDYYYNHKQIRRVIKNIFIDKQKKSQKFIELKELITHTLSKKSIKEMRRFVRIYGNEKSTIMSLHNADEDKSLYEIITTIEGNKTAHNLYNGKKFKIRDHKFVDGVTSVLSKITNFLSGLFGNFFGKFRFRKGYMYEQPKFAQSLMEQLRPLDILAEKTPFALTDKFIPGHYGHIALYLGTEEQLKEIGMWDSEIIKPHQEAIRSGKVIIEALRPGTWLNSLEEFLNIDEIGIYRAKEALNDKVDMERTYKIALEQLGKDYDFNFDVSTIDTVVCSELVYHAMGKINWPTKYILGRPTISPDQLVQLVFYKDQPVDFILANRAEKEFEFTPLPETDIAEKLGFELNTDKSSPEDTRYDKATRRCRIVRKRERNRDRRSVIRYVTKEYKVCYTEREEMIYSAPDDSIYDYESIKKAASL